jgi:hypothetical protein
MICIFVEADFTLISTLNYAENNQRLIGVLNQRCSASNRNNFIIALEKNQ